MLNSIFCIKKGSELNTLLSENSYYYTNELINSEYTVFELDFQANKVYLVDTEMTINNVDFIECASVIMPIIAVPAMVQMFGAFGIQLEINRLTNAQEVNKFFAKLGTIKTILGK